MEYRPLDGNRKKQVQGGGLLGFGCGTAMVFLLVAALYLPTTRRQLIVIALIALAAGGLAAKFGDSFFTWTLEKVRWLFWW